jgi:tetratricopeptide (TPR) repeat protein
LLQPGDRAAAQPEFTAAAEAHRRRDLAAAVAGYRRATAADPAFFEAHHNLALVALDQGDLPLALLSGENALQLRPADLDTRRDFARALQAAGHAADAAEQLELVLSSRPADTALHLAVAGIYAADLGDATRARAHYERVLALEPAHPQAGTIRSWLAANPR